MSDPVSEQRALRWGNRAAMTLQHNWVGWVQQRTSRELILVDNDSNAVRLVTPDADDSPLNLVISDWRGMRGVNEGRYVMCVHDTLWFGNVGLRLPGAAAWDSTLYWQAPATVAALTQCARQLALLADWLLARAPEGTIAALIPDLLWDARPTAAAAQRSDLSKKSRLLLVNTTEVLSYFMPALAAGNMADVEQGARQLVGLGEGTFPAGASLLIGLVAGVRFWPPFLHDGSGLHPDGVVHRLARGHLPHTTFLGNAMLRAASENEWEARWHALHTALTAHSGSENEQRDYVRSLAADWIGHDSERASASLAGVLLPFLWHQYHIER